MAKQENNKKYPAKPQVSAAPVSEQPKKTHAQDTPPVAPTKPLFTDSVLRKFFYGSLIAMLVTMWFTGWNVGYCSDEMDMNAYGKANYRYYFSGGKDTSFVGTQKGLELGEDSVYFLLKYYGNAFESIAVGFNKVTGLEKSTNIYNSRHAINQLFAILAVLFTGLIVRKLAGWGPAIITVWFLYITPSFFGHALFDTKDIPFCTSNIAAIYFMIMLLEELPVISWKTTFGLLLSFAFTTNTRIAGILLLFYLAVFLGIYIFTNKDLFNRSMKNIKDIIYKLFVISAGGMLLVIFTWPFLLRNPIHNIIETMNIVKKFPQKINVNFEGICYDSKEIPPYFLIKSMLITIPIFMMLAIAGGTVIYFANRKKYNWKLGALILVSSVFPVLFASLSHVPVYNGWRHFLFVYPGLCIMAGIGIYEILLYIKKTEYQIAFGVLCLLGMAKPILWCLKNHPYEYSYFNEVAGGFKNAYSSYDTDYWQISIKDGVDWLMTKGHLAETKDSITIASNSFSVAKYYIARNYPKAKIKVVSSGITGRNSLYWQYAIFSTLFIKPDYLENFFPPPQTIHSETIDGLTITAVMRDTARLDWWALEALKHANHRLSDSLYTAHIKTTHDSNAALFGYISVAKASLNENTEAIADAEKCLQYHFSNVLDYNCYCGLGIAYANLHQFDLSISKLQTAEKVLPAEHYSKDILRQVYQIKAMSGGK